jgi:hypothetical protein
MRVFVGPELLRNWVRWVLCHASVCRNRVIKELGKVFLK